MLRRNVDSALGSLLIQSNNLLRRMLFAVVLFIKIGIKGIIMILPFHNALPLYWNRDYTYIQKACHNLAHNEHSQWAGSCLMSYSNLCSCEHDNRLLKLNVSGKNIFSITNVSIVIADYLSKIWKRKPIERA